MFSHLRYIAKKNRDKAQITKFRNKKYDRNTNNCRRIFHQLFTKKLSNLHKMSKILRKQKLTKGKRKYE